MVPVAVVSGGISIKREIPFTEIIAFRGVCHKPFKSMAGWNSAGNSVRYMRVTLVDGTPLAFGGSAPTSTFLFVFIAARPTDSI